jgi:hypothetical protein
MSREGHGAVSLYKGRELKELYSGLFDKINPEYSSLIKFLDGSVKK